MGSPEFAVPSLDRVYQDTELLAVFSQPDKPRGRRGRELEPTAVKRRALELGVPVYEPKRIREDEVVSLLRGYRPEAIFVVAYAKLIPAVILEMPKYGCINVHPSLLPRYRGATPLQAALFNGDSETGVCTFFMDEGYDTGDLIVVERTPIGEEENFSQLSSRLARMGADVLAKTIKELQAGTALRQKQPAEAEGGYTKMLTKDELVIDWSQPAQVVRNRIRGLADDPCASTFLASGEGLKVGRVSLTEGSGKPGEVLGLAKGKGPVVACGQGALTLEMLKPAGKGWMDGSSFWNGGKITAGDLLGPLSGSRF